MPGYIKAALHKFQHPTPIRPENAPHTWSTPVYGAKHNTLRSKNTALCLLKRERPAASVNAFAEHGHNRWAPGDVGES
jgi:hypothetical protein